MQRMFDVDSAHGSSSIHGHDKIWAWGAHSITRNLSHSRRKTPERDTSRGTNSRFYDACLFLNTRYSRTLISGTASSGRKLISGRFSDSFHRQNVQRLAGLSCKRELYACFLPSRLSKFDCKGILPYLDTS
jgi:hypothetical protein